MDLEYYLKSILIPPRIIIVFIFFAFFVFLIKVQSSIVFYESQHVYLVSGSKSNSNSYSRLLGFNITGGSLGKYMNIIFKGKQLNTYVNQTVFANLATNKSLKPNNYNEFKSKLELNCCDNINNGLLYEIKYKNKDKELVKSFLMTHLNGIESIYSDIKLGLDKNSIVISSALT